MRQASACVTRAARSWTMADLELIGGAASNYVWACRIALPEKGVPRKPVSTIPHTAEVGALHPFGDIPGRRPGPPALCESRASGRYIDDAFARPQPVRS